jgi:hypothetical protein
MHALFQPTVEQIQENILASLSHDQSIHVHFPSLDLSCLCIVFETIKIATNVRGCQVWEDVVVVFRHEMESDRCNIRAAHQSLPNSIYAMV